MLNMCGEGYICLGGSIGPFDVPCPVNTWSSAGQETCSQCRGGFYCPIGSGSEIACPQGFYCPEAELYPVKCPRGRYGKIAGLESEIDCEPCDAGHVCSQSGLIEPDGLCDPGYYCLGGSWTPQPDPDHPEEKEVGGVCQPGSYCPRGSEEEKPCPPGTYNNFPGMREESDCIPCTPGYYCIGEKNPNPTGLCDAGYYCEGGSQSA